MNETLNILYQRRSLRRFDPAPLREDEKEKILNGAMQVLSAGAMMLYSIIEVENHEKKKALAGNCDHQHFIAEASAINPMARLNPGQHNCIRKFTAPFSLEMTRSIRAILQNWKED